MEDSLLFDTRMVEGYDTGFTLFKSCINELL